MVAASDLSNETGSGFQDNINQAGIKLMGGVRLVVEEGLHAGAKTTIKSGSFSLGSNEKSDVVLLADELAAHHAHITLLNPWTGRLRVEAQDQPIRTIEGQVVENGRYIDLTLPAKFQAGKAEFRVESVQDMSRIKKIGVIAGAIALAALVLPSITSFFTYRPEAMMMDVAPAPSSIFGNTGLGRQTTTQPVKDSLSLDQWRGNLQDKLGAAGLIGQVSIEKGSTGNLVAVGTVEPQSLEKWRDVIKWYDSQSGAPMLVNNVTRGDVAVQIPTFRAIWVDAKPQVVLTNGQTANVGDTISGGWKIESIDSNGVLLTREGRSTRVAF